MQGPLHGGTTGLPACLLGPRLCQLQGRGLIHGLNQIGQLLNLLGSNLGGLAASVRLWRDATGLAIALKQAIDRGLAYFEAVGQFLVGPFAGLVGIHDPLSKVLR